MKSIILIITLLLIAGCTINDRIIKESGNSVAKIQAANTIKSLADTRKIKANNQRKFLDKTQEMLEHLPVEKQSFLIEKTLQAQVKIASNNQLKGLAYASSFWLIMFFLTLIGKYFFDRKKQNG
jgi:hypothetical protein